MKYIKNELFKNLIESFFLFICFVFNEKILFRCKVFNNMVIDCFYGWLILKFFFIFVVVFFLEGYLIIYDKMFF